MSKSPASSLFRYLRKFLDCRHFSASTGGPRELGEAHSRRSARGPCLPEGQIPKGFFQSKQLAEVPRGQNHLDHQFREGGHCDGRRLSANGPVCRPAAPTASRNRKRIVRCSGAAERILIDDQPDKRSRFPKTQARWTRKDVQLTPRTADWEQKKLSYPSLSIFRRSAFPRPSVPPWWLWLRVRR